MDKQLQDKAIDFKGKKYVLVSDRVLFFNEKFPEGSITTELISNPNDDTVIIKATVKPNDKQTFTGYSQATWDDGYINKTSALENAETSAVGRALGFMGIGVIESIASADEINKAQTYPTKAPITPEIALGKAKEAISAIESSDDLERVRGQIKASKYIPDRRSQEGKDMRDELEQLLANKAQNLIGNGAVPFEG